MSRRTRKLAEIAAVAATSPPTIRLTREQVPPVPKSPEWQGGKWPFTVIDHNHCRWRFLHGKLVAYFEYRPKEDRDRGIFPWEKMWVDPTFASR